MWYLSIRRDVRPRSEWTVTLEEHLRWVRERHDSGQFVISGPTTDRTLSLALFRADSLPEAQAIADSDPMVVAHCASAEVIEWEVHQILGAGAFTASTEHALQEDRAAFEAFVREGE
jgi:uncharacterized protein YciI